MHFRLLIWWLTRFFHVFTDSFKDITILVMRKTAKFVIII